MGLDTSHDCWHGAYAGFYRWRLWLGRQIGLPLGMMAGYMGAYFGDGDADRISDMELRLAAFSATTDGPIPWSLIDDPLVPLLSHSDCDGRLRWWECKGIAIRLGQILRGMDRDATGSPHARGCYDGMYNATKRFALGCLRAWKAREDVVFR